jgi:hypothetical protein
MGLRVGTMINGKLQDFAAGVMARSQVSFGDVRRLQRDCLPDGITMRDEAESLVALNAKLVRADKAWAEWLVPALAQFVGAQQSADGSDAEATGAWLKALFAGSAPSAALGRKITRYMRRREPEQPADETTTAQPQRVRRKPRTCKAEPRRRTRAAVRSEIMLRPARRPVARRTRTTPGATILPCEIWSAGIMDKHIMEMHLRFQLARPAA